MFEFTIPAISLIFTGVALLMALLCTAVGLYPYRRAARADENEPADSPRPKVSVIVFCQSDLDVLMATLEAIDRQDYLQREVVVVCDSSAEYAASVAEMAESRFNDVYVTFVPPGSHNLSRRKLANTVGIKAAKGDVVLTTVANIRIPSDRWLSEMMAPFCGEAGRHTDIVLGATMVDFEEMSGAGKWYRQFISTLTDGRWIGYGLSGHPFRGDALNMAFRRQFFFDIKGYANTNHLHNGDDDVQLRGIASAANTKVVASASNILLTQWGKSANRVWSLRRSAYNFTRRWLPWGPFMREAFVSWAQWLVPAAAVVGALTGLPSIWPLIAGVIIVLAMWGIEIYNYRSLAARLGTVRLWWAVVPFRLWKPIGNALFNMEHRGTRKKNYTWER